MKRLVLVLVALISAASSAVAEGGGIGGSLIDSPAGAAHAKPRPPHVIIKHEVVYVPRPASTRPVAPAQCTVTDPTGTPLNVRSKPNGPIVGALNNGDTVGRKQTVSDNRGRQWSYVIPAGTGRAGWIFRDFVTCN